VTNQDGLSPDLCVTELGRIEQREGIAEGVLRQERGKSAAYSARLRTRTLVPERWSSKKEEV